MDRYFRQDAIRVFAVVFAGMISLGCGGGGGGESPPGNAAPILHASQISVAEDASVIAQLVAADADGDGLTYAKTGNPTLGVVESFNANGSFTYRPLVDATGADSFDVTVNDSKGHTTAGTVYIQISSVNDAPTGKPLALTVTEDTAKSARLNASDVDGDSLTFAITSVPVHGSVTDLKADGSFTYTPAHDYFGNESFAATATDPSGAAATIQVDVTVSGVADAFLAKNDILTAPDAAALAGLNVLANDTNPDGNAVSIQEQALIGQASVNADSTVRITDLPAGFRGVTRFKYKLTDEAGAVSSATAVVFVDVDPFKIAFIADKTGNRGYELFKTDLAGEPVQVTNAASTNLFVNGFVSSETGDTIAYSRRDLNTNLLVDVAIARASSPGSDVVLQAPAGVAPLRAPVVSRDGQWVAVVGGSGGGPTALLLVNVAQPTVLHPVITSGTAYVDRAEFSDDGAYLYFQTREPTGNAPYKAYRVTTANPAAAPADLCNVPADMNCLIRNLGGIKSTLILKISDSEPLIPGDPNYRDGVYWADAANPTLRTQLNVPLAPGEWIQNVFTASLSTSVRSPSETLIGYTIATGLLSSTEYPQASFVVDLSDHPTSRQVAGVGALFTNIRPDQGAVLYTTESQPGRYDQLYEVPIDGSAPPVFVGQSQLGNYDSTGNTVFLQNTFVTPTPALYFIDGTAYRESFGSTQRLGTPGLVHRMSDASASDRGVVLIGEVPLAEPFPVASPYALVNERAPDKLLYLSNLNVPRLVLPGTRAFFLKYAAGELP